MQARSLFNKPRKHREAKKKHNECGVNTTLHTDSVYPALIVTPTSATTTRYSAFLQDPQHPA